MTNPLPSREALRAILDEGGSVAELIRARIDRSLISRYLGGDRIPGLGRRIWLHDVTDGRVTRDGWLSSEALERIAREAADTARRLGRSSAAA